MCNPRRVKVTATCDLAEAWQREVTRTVQLSGDVRGEARVRQDLGASVGEPARKALEHALRAGVEGWTPVEGGYRRDVEGGYVVYLVEERVLEIVATQDDRVCVEETATQMVAGVLGGKLQIEGHGTYDPGWDRKTEEDAKREAKADADRKTEAEIRKRIRSAEQAGEEAAAADVEEMARIRGRQKLAQEQATRREQLAREAATHLETVGARARQAFHGLLARAYRDAIMAYAKARGAQNVQCTEKPDVLQIEFHLRG